MNEWLRIGKRDREREEGISGTSSDAGKGIS